MKRRIDLFLRLRSYAKVARELGLCRSTIQEYFNTHKFPQVIEVINELKRGQTICRFCFKERKIVSHGKCNACYKYFNYIPSVGRRVRRLCLT